MSLQVIEAWKEFRLQWDSNPCLPDGCWELLPTELQGHTLKVVHILKGFCFYSITHIHAELYSFCSKEKVDS